MQSQMQQMQQQLSQRQLHLPPASAIDPTLSNDIRPVVRDGWGEAAVQSLLTYTCT